MILNCEKCGTRYLVPSSAIGEDGRIVRCTNCGYEWFQAQEKIDLDLTETPEAPEFEPIPDSVKPLPEGAELPVLTVRPARIRMTMLRFSRPGPAQLAGYGAAAGVFVLIAVLLILMHGPLTRAWPASTAVYGIMGISTVVPGDGLSFEELSAVSGMDEKGVPVLKVEGRIVNGGQSPVEIPPLLSTIYDAKGKVMTRVRTPAPKPVAKAGEKVAFRALYPKAAGTAKDVRVSFAATPD